MKKIFYTLILLVLPALLNAQNYNPFVAQGVISPSPLYNVASGGSGQASFVVGNSGDDPIPLIANQEMVLVISLSRGIPYNANPLSALGGSYAPYFNWIYDPITKSYQGTQNQTIPGAINGGVGTITIDYQVTTNSTSASPQNGFNVNITPPPFTNGVNSLNDDQVSSYTWTVVKFETTPDVNEVIKNIPFTGNIHTNDNVPIGSTYGTPVPLSGNPSGCTPVVSSNGSYTFTCGTVGEYNFMVPVCEPSPSTNCINVPLVITVIDTTVLTNAPIANLDIATTYTGNPVIVNVKANDKCLNGAGCSLGTPTVTTSPAISGANTIVNSNGTITYIPAPNYIGKDSFKYNICDNQSPIQKCDLEWVYITVLPQGNPNTTLANDDFVHTFKSTNVYGSVKTNDNDPEGDTQTVTTQTTTIGGKGTLTLSSTGSYTFTPVSGFVGSVDFPYMTCDNNLHQACANATLHVLVSFNLAIVLPIQYAYFNIQRSDCDAKLNWATSQEENSAYFLIYRKGNNDHDFMQIAKVNASGNSHEIKVYQYTDENVGVGKYQYYLEEFDVNGKSQRSEVENVEITCTGAAISVYPNPAIDYINIKINSQKTETYSIKLVDMEGRTITETESNVNAGTKTIRLSTQQIASGVYHVIVTDKDNTRTFKIKILR